MKRSGSGTAVRGWVKRSGIGFRHGTKGFGFSNLQLRLETAAGACLVAYDSVAAKGGKFTGRADVAGGLRVTTELKPVRGLDAVTVTHTVRNTNPYPVWIRGAETGAFAPGAAVTAGKTHGLGWDLRFAHSDNLRTERYPHCLMDYPYLRVLPVEERELGRGEDQAFPALYLLERKTGAGLIVGALSQELNYTTFRLRKAPMVANGLFDVFAVRHDFAHAHGLLVPAGESRALDGIFVQAVQDLDLNDLFTGYTDFLAARNAFRGEATPLRTGAMHCTWNYGVFREQYAAPLLKTAKFIAKNLPGIRYFLVDSGYQKNTGSKGFQWFDVFYPDARKSLDPKRFPRGMRAFTDAVRKLGLRPGLWFSPTVSLYGDLYREHPEWFLQDARGGPYCIGREQGFLDFSVPEAAAFFDRTLKVIVGEWGMDAVKMDFWSQNFEARNARVADPRMTAVQCRTRMFEIIRKHLPDDGVFMTCVATGMGNPFIAKHADTYRNTIDIGAGVWDDQLYNCAWSLSTLPVQGRKTFLMNNDSVGAVLDCPENENLFRFAWSFIHQGMIETGGRMETWPAKYVEAMRRTTTHVDRGYGCRCADPAAFTGSPYPAVLYVDYPSDSPTARRGVRKHIALFNWLDEPQVVGAAAGRLGLAGTVTARDFFTDEERTFEGGHVSEVLPGRSARLYEVRVRG